jgi:hypothetical protein
MSVYAIWAVYGRKADQLHAAWFWHASGETRFDYATKTDVQINVLRPVGWQQGTY